MALAAEAGPGSIVLSGDSAGGGLALAVALSMRDEGQAPPAEHATARPALRRRHSAVAQAAWFTARVTTGG